MFLYWIPAFAGMSEEGMTNKDRKPRPAFIHGITSTIFQLGLVSAITKFRSRRKEIYEVVEPEYKMKQSKFMRDLLLFLYLILFPIAAMIVVIIYIYGLKGQL